METPPAEEPPPVETPPPVEPEPIVEPQTFTLPGQAAPPADELAFLRQQFANSQTQLAQQREQLENFELAGLSEADQEVVKARREMEDFRKQRGEWEQQVAADQTDRYLQQFASREEYIEHLGNPIQMYHSVLTGLHDDWAAEKAKRQQLEAQLLKVGGQPEPGPPVTTGGTGPASGQPGLFDLTPKDREAMKERARMGYDIDIPPV